MAKQKKTKEEADLNVRKPQIAVPLDKIELDPKNPRLGDEHLKGSQLDLLSTLYSEFDLEEIALSMSENGYFDEEPVVIVWKRRLN